MRRAEPPRARASMRMAGDEVTRGTTSAVNTLHAVSEDDGDARDERDQAGDRLHGAILPDARARSTRDAAQRRGEPRRGRPARHQRGRHLDRARAQQLAQALRLRVQTQVRGHAPAEDAVDDEVHRPQVRQRVAADRVRLDLGQQRLEHVDGEARLEPGRDGVVVGPEPRRWRRRPCPPSARRRAPTAGRPTGLRRRRRRVRRAAASLLGVASRGAAAAGSKGASGVAGTGSAVALDARRHGGGPDRRRPVAGDALGARRRRGEEGAGIARQARLDDGAREGPADRLLVVAAHGQAQVRHAAAGQVAREVLRRLGEGVPPARDAGPHRLGGEAGLLGHLGAGQRQRHGVAPAGVEVGRDLQRGRAAPRPAPARCAPGRGPPAPARWCRSAPRRRG